MSETELEDKTTEQPTEAVTSSEPLSSGSKTIKEIIRGSINEVREKEAKAAPAKPAGEPKAKPVSEKAPEPKPAGERQRDDAGRFTSADPKPAAEAQPSATAATAEIPAAQPAPSAAAPKASGGPPTSWSQEAKAAYATLPPAVQMAIAKREEEMDKGSKAHQDERNRYRELDQVIAPHRPSFQQAGIRSDAEAFKQLLDWRHALAGPNREHWYRELGRTIGINPSSQVQPQGQTEGQDQTQPAPPAYVQQLLNYVGSLEQRLNGFVSRGETESNARVAQEIADFAKDKPHFERVKLSMGMLMKAASDANQPIDLTEAYDRAIWADRELRAEMQAEAEQKRQQEAAAAAAKAAKEAEEKRKADEAKRAAEAEAKRKASVSPKGSTPSGKAANAARKPHSQSVKESILAAKSEIEGRA